MTQHTHMINTIRSVDWTQAIFLSAFYALALALPITEALKQISVIAIILLGIHLIFKKELKLDENLLTFSAGGLVVFSMISASFAFNPPTALKACIDIFRIIMIFLIIKHFPLNLRQLVNFNKILFFSMTVALFYGLYKLYFVETSTFLELHSVGQASSSIYLLFIFSIALSCFFSQNNLPTHFLLFIIISSFAGILITDNSIVLFTSILLIVLLFIATKQYKKPKLLAIFVLIVPFAILFGSEYSLDEFFMSQRNELIDASIRAWLDHNIFFGIGAENFNQINLQNYTQTEISHAYTNTYITFLLEGGLCGLGLYLLFLFAVLGSLLKQYHNTKNRLITAALLIWLANFIISGFNTTFHDENGLLMALIWGLALNKDLKADNVVSNGNL